MRPREGVPTRRIGCRGQRQSTQGGAVGRLLLGVALAVIVLLSLVASASASPLFVKQVATGDVPQLGAPVGLHQLDSGALRSLSAGASSAFPILPGSPSARGIGDIFYDGFEGSVGHWYLASDPPDTHTWGFWTYRPAVGAWSAYCAGDLIQPPGPYANDMFAEMWTNQIDLSGMTSAQLDYKLYCDTEINYDFLYVLVSADDFQTYGWVNYTGDSWEASGNTQGWVDDFIDLADVPGLGSVCGQSNVSIEFLFVSDESNVAEGAYVDEVRVSNPPKPVVVTMTALPQTVGYNMPVSIAGSLTNASGTPLPNRPVDLYTSFDDDYYFYHSTLSSATGSYATTVRIDRRTYFWLWFEGDSAYDRGSSVRLKVMARGKLTPPAFSRTVRRGVKITAWGTLLPRHSAAANKVAHTKAELYRYSNGKYRRVLTTFAKSCTNTTTATKYKVVVYFNKSGKWRVRAIHEDPDHARTVSSWRYFIVR